MKYEKIKKKNKFLIILNIFQKTQRFLIIIFKILNNHFKFQNNNYFEQKRTKKIKY